MTSLFGEPSGKEGAVGVSVQPRRERRGLAWLLGAGNRRRQTVPAELVRWQKAIRALHAECDQLRRRMERSR